MTRKHITAHESVFAVRVRPETFTKTTRGTISGVIYIAVGNDFAFPNDKWDDVVVEVVSWWMRIIADGLSGSKSRCICRFMDGSFRYEVDAQSSGLWLIYFIKGAADEAGEVLHEVTCESYVVADALLRAAEIIMEACRERRWVTIYTEHLTRDYTRLSQLRNELSPVNA